MDSFNTSLWPLFTQHNPYKFYNIEQRIDYICKNIIRKRNEDDKVRKIGKQNKQKVDPLKESSYLRAANFNWR